MPGASRFLGNSVASMGPSCKGKVVVAGKEGAQGREEGEGGKGLGSPRT